MEMKLYSIKPGLKAARTAAHLTQDQLAQQMGRHLKTIMNWEQGIAVPEFEDLVKLADLLHCSIDFLTGRIKCTTHDAQFIYDQTGLSESAIQKLKDLKESGKNTAEILSRIIDHRLFVILIKNIEYMTKANFSREYSQAYAAYLLKGTPYIDTPDDFRAVYEYQCSRILSSIIGDLK